LTHYASPARRGAASTSQGHPRTIFRRALERGNLLVAEATAREIGVVSLLEALELTLLITQKEPHRHPRVAARWLLRYLEESDDVTIEQAAMAASCLAALGSDEKAPGTLRAMAERATRRPRARGVA
jgi:hypothetical protein